MYQKKGGGPMTSSTRELLYVSVPLIHPTQKIKNSMQPKY